MKTPSSNPEHDGVDRRPIKIPETVPTADFSGTRGAIRKWVMQATGKPLMKPKKHEIASQYSKIAQNKGILPWPITSEIRYEGYGPVDADGYANMNMTMNRESSLKEELVDHEQREKFQAIAKKYQLKYEAQNALEYGFNPRAAEEYVKGLGLPPARVLYLTDLQFAEIIAEQPDVLLGKIKNVPKLDPTYIYNSGLIIVPLERNLPPDITFPNFDRGRMIEAIGIHEMLHARAGFQTFTQAKNTLLFDRSGFSSQQKWGTQHGAFFEEAFPRYHEYKYLQSFLYPDAEPEAYGIVMPPETIFYRKGEVEVDPNNIVVLAFRRLAAANPELPELALNVRKGHKGSLLAFRKGITKIAPGLYGKLRNLQYDNSGDFYDGYVLVNEAIEDLKDNEK